MRAPRIRINDISYHLPEQVVTNDDLSREHPGWEMGRVEARTGVSSRHIAGREETALDLAVTTSNDLLLRNPDLRALVDGIIFCTQTADYVMPPNACLLHRELDLRDDVLAFDINLACSGYIYAVAIAQGLIVAGTCANVLVVTADTYSKYIHPGDRATRTLFGDAAAVSWICATDDSTGVVDVLCETSGRGFENFYMPAGGLRTPRSPATRLETIDSSGNIRTPENIHMNGMAVLSFVTSKVPGQVRRILERNEVGLSDLDLVIFHQASQVALDSLARSLTLPRERVFHNLATVGNTVSASIPISLAQARSGGLIRPGSTVLLSGFGVGLSWASALLRA